MTTRVCAIGLLCASGLAMVTDCASVPAFSFYESGAPPAPDSTTDSDSAMDNDSATDSGSMAMDGTAGDDGSQPNDSSQSVDAADAIGDASDGSLETGCTSGQPLGVTPNACCGTVWCVGDCEDCGKCVTMMCNPAVAFCCERAGTLNCKGLSGRCL